MARPPKFARHSPHPALHEPDWAAVSRKLSLSNRQGEIVQLVFRGLQDKQIASALNLSVATIRTHLRVLYARLGLDNRVQLVLLIVTRSLEAHHD